MTGEEEILLMPAGKILKSVKNRHRESCNYKHNLYINLIK